MKRYSTYEYYCRPYCVCRRVADTPYYSHTVHPLLEDVDNGQHKIMKPSQMYKTRPEYYEKFELDEFRNHIYQEQDDSHPKREIRFEYKKKKWLYPELHADHPRLLQHNQNP